MNPVSTAAAVAEPAQVAAELSKGGPSSILSLVGLCVAVAVLGSQVQAVQTQLGSIQSELTAMRLTLASSDAWTRTEQDAHRRDVEAQIRAIADAQHELRARVGALEHPRSR